MLPPLLSLVSFARVAAIAGRRFGPPRSTDPADGEVAAYVGSILRRLPWPWRYTCLRRGIVLFHLLRRAGRPVSLAIGVRKDKAGALEAHAWLTLDGKPYLEPNPEEHRSFAVIATFPEQAG